MLAELRSHPSTHQSLKNTFRQLRYASDEALDRLSRRGELRREVVRLYRHFRNNSKDYYDREDLALSAADAVRRGSVSGLSDLGFIIFFQLRDVTPAEREMIEALASNGECAVFLGLTGDQEADAPVEALAERLSSVLGEPERSSPSQTSTDTRLLIAPDPHQEIRWVIRHIVKQAESGVPLYRMAALYGKQDPYATLIREELELAGIPLAGPNSAPLSDTAVGRTLTGLISLSDGEFTRNAVTSWFTGCPVRPSSGHTVSFSPSHWDAISQKAGIVHGLNQWQERLERYANEMERLSARAEAMGEVSEARASLMKTEANSARSLREFITELAERTAPPRDGSSWEEFSRWAKNLLERYLVPESDLPDAEQEALRGIREKLDELKGVDAVETGPSFSVFAQALDEALQGTLGHLGVTGQGVFVAPIVAAVAMNFDVVHLVGMIEGAVPPPAKDDPLVPDREKQAAGGPSAGLPLQQSRRADERYAFLSALAAAPTRVLTFPRADPAAQRGHYPSRWFLEQASTLEGSAVYTSTLWSLGNRPWLTIIPSMEQALASVSVESAADLHDYDMERLWVWKNSGFSIRNHPAAKSGLLERALTLGRRRNSSRFTEWDGDLSGMAQGSAIVKGLARQVLSPTSLQRWAECPFSYFLRSVLKLSSLEKPEEAYSMTPLEKGSLIHEILEKFVGGAIRDGSLPESSEPWSAAHRDALRQIAARAFRDAEVRGVTGKSLMWQLDQANILSDLDTFLESDARLRKRFGVSPTRVEARFGLGGNSWPEATMALGDGVTLRFSGVIDRVDIDAEGKTALVMDYKTGGTDDYNGIKKDPVDRGKKLQLPIYSLAVLGALGAGIDIKAAYWFVTTRENFALLPSETVSFDAVQEQFKNAVTTIVSGIGSGLFPANPGKEDRGSFKNCRYCEFDTLCPSRRDVMWEQKKQDSRLAEYVELSGED